MITIGVDAHKQVHVALALDDAGRELGHWRGRTACPAGRVSRTGRASSEQSAGSASRALGDMAAAWRRTSSRTVKRSTRSMRAEPLSVAEAHASRTRPTARMPARWRCSCIVRRRGWRR